MRRLRIVVPVLALLTGACGSAPASSPPMPQPVAVTPSPPRALPSPTAGGDGLPGMPPVVGGNVYARTRPQDLAPAVRDAKRYVYVPNGKDDTVTVLDQRDGSTVRTFPVGRQPEHVVPSYDLKWLYVTSDLGNSLTKIDPRTGQPVGRIAVDDPYNLYFTPDGAYSIVVAERLQRLDFRDPQTMAMRDSTPLDCKGVDHLDFSGDGRYFIATCEFAGRLVKVDTATHKVLGYLDISADSQPQDIRVAADGSTFFVADQGTNSVEIVDGPSFRIVDTVTGLRGAHGIYPSRAGTSFYVSDRRGSAVTVLDMRTHRPVATWRIPGGGSPDMGGVSIDGGRLWLSGRYTSFVYAFDTTNGQLVRKIKVGNGPHGMTVWPQPGRYSLGHTTNTR